MTVMTETDKQEFRNHVLKQCPDAAFSEQTIPTGDVLITAWRRGCLVTSRCTLNKKTMKLKTIPKYRLDPDWPEKWLLIHLENGGWINEGQKTQIEAFLQRRLRPAKL